MEDSVIDRAMDAAEARLSAETDIEATPVETPDTEGTENALEDIAVKEALDKPSKVRDTSGKFTKPPTTEEKVSDQATDVDTAEVEPQEESQGPSVEPPAFWSAEAKEAFAKGDVAAIQRYAVEHEQQRTEWANRVAQDVAHTKKYQERVNETFEPYRLKLQAAGIRDEVEAASRLLAWNEMLTKDVRGFCINQLKLAGLSPHDLLEAQQQQYPTDPRVEQALQAAEEAKRAAEEYKTHIESQKQQALIQQVESFKDGKDSSGQTRRQFAEMYAPQIHKAFEEIQAETGLPIQESLNHAYEFVMQKVRGLHGTTQKIQSPQPVQQVKRAQAAAKSVVGAPSSGTNVQRPRAKTIEEAMDRAEERLSSH